MLRRYNFLNFKKGSRMRISKEELSRSLRSFPIAIKKVYDPSFLETKELIYGLIRVEEGKKWMVLGEKEAVRRDSFIGRCYDQELTLKVCDLNWENTQVLMERFPSPDRNPSKNSLSPLEPETVWVLQRLAIFVPFENLGYVRFWPSNRFVKIIRQEGISKG
jgi:hypothetical protein